MGKRRVDAKEAVADIRSGMDDYGLMMKYQLASDGLQSLLDKLVARGYIDLAELEARNPGFLGTLTITDPIGPNEDIGQTHGQQPATAKTVVQINAQEITRDIRSGMDDSALMKKFHLSSKGLQKMTAKLVNRGLITQELLDERTTPLEHTVDLREYMLGLDAVLKDLGKATAKKAALHQHQERVQPTEEPGKVVAAKADRQPEPTKQVPVVFKTPWYDNSILTIFLLIACFPLGLYALYLNSSLSRLLKIPFAAGGALLFVGCLLLLSNLFGRV